MVRPIASLALLLALCTPLQAQELDIDALIETIDMQTSQYTRLVEILEGTEANRSLAAFDAMVGTGDPTMIEIATTTALASTDGRLRARALWETLTRKDKMTLFIETEELSQERRAALDEWIGAQSSWSLYQDFPETQCINLASSSNGLRVRNLTVTGLGVEMLHDSARMSGRFTLDPTGALVGSVTNTSSNDVYTARIDLR